MRIGRMIAGILLASTILPGPKLVAGPSPFVLPKTRAEWEGRRPALVREIEGCFGEGAFAPAEFAHGGTSVREREDGVRFLSFRYEGGVYLRGVCAWMPSDAGLKRPGLLYLASPAESATILGGNVPLKGDQGPELVLGELARRGFFALWVDAGAGTFDRKLAEYWARILRTDRAALSFLRNTDVVDAGKIGVLGYGVGGARAAWLMALEPSVRCGLSLGGMTRVADWAAAIGPDAPPWMAKVADGRDLDAIVALCAGRTFDWTVGDRDPISPPRGVSAIETAARAMERLVGDGHSDHITRLSRQDGRYGRLQWLGVTEVFDKAFFPHGPTPLGHPPEPEPAVTADFVDLAANGLAGWALEMSQRPTTWTWTDGRIVCKPGPDEYGWLRAPIEVGDFILTVEWKVPARGNSGIFLRAKPVPWTFPPSAANKRIVSALGLDWPSRTGLELQAQDDPGSADKFSSGSLYRHAAPAKNPTNPPGRWNRYTVRARGARVEVWSNGEQVLDTRIDQYPLTLADPPLRGYIGLQNHGAPAEFRNVKLLRLSR